MDQAAELRRMMEVLPRSSAPALNTIAVTSGKGGVGKTSIAVNLSLALAEAGARPVLVDADLGLSNADILLGLTPVRDLRDVMRGLCRMEDILVEGPLGMLLLPGASGVAELANMDRSERAHLQDGLSMLAGRAGMAILDTAPGISDSVVDLATAADETLVVTTPEPTSLADAYASAKVILQRRPRARVGLVVNLAESRAHAQEIARGFAGVTSRFLGVEVPLRGFVCEDWHVPDAVRRRQPFLLCHPKSLAASCVRDLARALLS